MKKALFLVLAVMVALLASCNWFAPLPQYAEKNDAGNGTSATAEEVDLTADLRYEIVGTISSADDEDYYKIPVPANAKTLYLDTYYNDEKVKGLFGISLFPLNFVEYNAAGGDYVHLLVGAVNENTLELSDVDSIILHIYGNSDYPSGSYKFEVFVSDM